MRVPSVVPNAVCDYAKPCLAVNSWMNLPRPQNPNGNPVIFNHIEDMIPLFDMIPPFRVNTTLERKKVLAHYSLLSTHRLFDHKYKYVITG